MRAALVTAFDRPPQYIDDHPEPRATHEDEAVVEVVAVGLHPRVRSQAGGLHHTRTDELPLVPGIDAVVRDQKQQLRYVVMDDTRLGTLAERTVIDLRRSVPLARDTDPILVAAAVNPVMASWMALTRRINFRRGQRVLVLGATGNAGRMAVQVAKRLGAGQVIAAGRNPRKLAELTALGADTTCLFDGLSAAANVDVVLDFVWGIPTVDALKAMIPVRADRSAALTWVQIGSVAGLESTIPSAALRAARLNLVGSGIGSIPPRDYLREAPALLRAVVRGGFDVRPKAMPLSEVEAAWEIAGQTSERIVLTP